MRMSVRVAVLGGLLACALAAGLSSCSSTAAQRATPPPPGPPPLRIGVNSTSPPYVFQQDGRYVGMEVDFARQLGQALGRQVRFVDLPFDQILPALLENRIDIAMSGLTITKLREMRVAFSDPYLRSGLLAMMQRRDLERFPTVASVLSCNARISVVNGTTGEKFIRQRCAQGGTIYPTNSTEIAISEVKLGRSDVLIQDAPIVVWAVSANEGVLAFLRQPLNREDLGWAMRRDDEALVAQVNGVLARWQANGTRAAVLDRWVPYWRSLEQQTANLP